MRAERSCPVRRRQNAAGLRVGGSLTSLAADRRPAPIRQDAAAEVMVSGPLKSKIRPRAEPADCASRRGSSPGVPRYPSYRDLAFSKRNYQGEDRDGRGLAVRLARCAAARACSPTRRRALPRLRAAHSADEPWKRRPRARCADRG